MIFTKQLLFSLWESVFFPQNKPSKKFLKAKNNRKEQQKSLT